MNARGFVSFSFVIALSASGCSDNTTSADATSVDSTNTDATGADAPTDTPARMDTPSPSDAPQGVDAPTSADLGPLRDALSDAGTTDVAMDVANDATQDTSADVDAGALRDVSDGGTDSGADALSDVTTDATCSESSRFSCVAGTPGGTCSDALTLAVCTAGVWSCPSGMIPLSLCGCAGRPPGPSCTCVSGGWQCTTDAGVSGG